MKINGEKMRKKDKSWIVKIKHWKKGDVKKKKRKGKRKKKRKVKRKLCKLKKHVRLKKHEK